MDIAKNLVVFFISWWLILFMVLPFGVRTAEEEGTEVEPGTVPSAPVRPRLLMKAGITTLLAALVWLAFWLVNHYNLITVQDFYR